MLFPNTKRGTISRLQRYKKEWNSESLWLEKNANKPGNDTNLSIRYTANADIQRLCADKSSHSLSNISNKSAIDRKFKKATTLVCITLPCEGCRCNHEKQRFSKSFSRKNPRVKASAISQCGHVMLASLLTFSTLNNRKT